MDELKQRESKVFDFMDEVNRHREHQASMDAYKNSEEYKRKCLDKEMNNAKDTCLNYIFADIYKNSIPLDPDYKSLHSDELDREMKDFINQKVADKGISVYVKEAIKKGNPTMKRLMEAVEDFVNSVYLEKSINIKNIAPEDLNFRFGEEEKKKMDSISRDLELDDISKIIQNNVKKTAEFEIRKAKENKAEIEELENILSSDDSITEESAIDSIVETKNAKRSKIYEPSFFESIMIKNFNKAGTTMESGEETDPYEIFCESVREFTRHNILKALRLEVYDRSAIRRMSSEFSSM